MAKLGSKKRPAVVRVRSVARAGEIVAYCDERGWEVIVGVEPEETEYLSDFEKLTDGTKPGMSTIHLGDAWVGILVRPIEGGILALHSKVIAF